MEAAFWHERWAKNEIGFHQDGVTPVLETYWNEIVESSAAEVFVPLCGKSTDLLWLAQRGHEVVGVELSQTAVDDFFAEQGLEASFSMQGDLREYHCNSESITIFQGDFFSLPEAVVTRCPAVFDRGSLIALPPVMREAYVETFKSRMQPGAEIMLVTLEHSNENNPPFSLQESDVRDLYQDAFSVQRIGEQQEEFRGQLATNVVYRLTKKGKI